MTDPLLRAKDVAERSDTGIRKVLRMNTPQFEETCKSFDWQWYWRDSATVVAQTRLMDLAKSLDNTFVAVYESHRLKAQNPYCPLKANFAVDPANLEKQTGNQTTKEFHHV